MSTVTEAELKASATKPRVTAEGLEANIKHEYYFTGKEAIEAAGYGGVPADVGVLTFCVLVLQNGYTVHGISACANPANFNAEIGKRLAYDKAKNKIWELMGYELKSEVANAGGTFKDRVRNEHSELLNKITKLASFVGTPTFSALSSEEKTRLRQQLRIMREYELVLEQRINDMA